MRWISWLIAVLALALGLVVLRFGDRSPLVQRADRTFQDVLIDVNRLPRHAPIPITLVDMEDAENWTALEYTLFLKALPKENPPVVIFTSLPPSGNTAFHRAFNEMAIKQPRLVLPVILSAEKTETSDADWWLKGWNSHYPKPGQISFTSVADGPPEILRGTVEVGIANLPKQAETAPLYFQIGEKSVPSLAMRAALLAGKMTDEDVHFDFDMLMGEQRLKGVKNSELPLDFTFLPGIRRLASSDLLLNLVPDSPNPRMMLEGVVILGDFSEKNRFSPLQNGEMISPAEWIAATIATICNGPVLTMVSSSVQIGILVLSVFGTFLFPRVQGIGKWFTLLFVLAIYFLFSMYLAEKTSWATPLALPLGVLGLGLILHQLAALIKKHE